MTTDVSNGEVDLLEDLGVDLPNLNLSWPLDVSTRGVDLPADLGVDLPNLSSQTFRCGHHRGLFILHMKDQLLLNNFQCNCLQEIHSHFWGDPSAKVSSSAKFGVAVFKASILDSLGGPSAKVGLSANFGVLVFKASLLYYLGAPYAKVCSSAKFCVLVFKASMLY